MQILKSRYEEDIQNSLKSFLRSKSLDEFCINIGNNFLELTGQVEPPFSILKLISQKQITLIFDKTLLVSGKIETGPKGFIIKVNLEKIKNKQYYNLTLAHEVAHTYFFNTSSQNPSDISGLLTTSPALEYLCNKIARFLVVPSISLLKSLEDLPKIGSELFSFRNVVKLCEIYQTTPYVIFKRCIHDELHWNVLYLKFKYFSDDKTWKLTSSHYPQYISSIENRSKFFIPQSSVKNKWPSAKKALARFLNDVYLELKYNPIINKIVTLKDIIGEPLHSIFHDIADDQLLIHLSLDDEINCINLIVPLNESVYGFKLAPNGQ